MQIMGKTLENLKHKWEKEWKKNGKRMEKEWKKNGTCGQFTSPSFYTETRGPKLWLTVVLLILLHPAGNGASIFAKALKQLRCVSVSCARIQVESWGVTIQPDVNHP
jgi:hypothetical protein